MLLTHFGSEVNKQIVGERKLRRFFLSCYCELLKPGITIEDLVLPRLQPSLQGTEMWLSIIYIIAAYLGTQKSLRCESKGVHRINVAALLS